MASAKPTTASPLSPHQADEAHVRSLVEGWAAAVRNADMDGLLASHAYDIVIYDVIVEAQGIEAYRKLWDEFFSYQGQGAFDLRDLTIAVGEDVAFCHSLVTCGPKEPAGQFKVRLSLGLRKIDGEWVVTHEHHSVPSE